MSVEQRKEGGLLISMTTIMWLYDNLYLVYAIGPKACGT